MSSTASVVVPQQEMGPSPLQELVKDYPADLVQKVHNILEAENKKQMDDLSVAVREENKKAIDAAMEEIQKKLKPPTQEEIQKLLNQELMEFTVTVGGTEKRKFTIVELPQAVEKKMVRVIRDRLVPIATEISALTMNLLQGDAADKLVKLMSTFEPALGVMTDLCVIVLNPYGDDKEVTLEWVEKNLTSQRILSIVVAQFECNRMRDFFSQLSLTINSMT
jgi:hypothetical protein